MLANLLIMTLHGSAPDLFIWHRYYIPSYICLALLAGTGVQWLGPWISRWAPRRLQLVSLLLPALLAWTHWEDFDRHDFRIAEDFSRQVLQALPPGATLMASDDNILFVLIYLKLVEGVRPDVDLILQGVGNQDIQPFKFDPAKDAVFFTHHPNWNIPDLEIAPLGLAFRAWRPNLPRLSPLWEDPVLEGADDPDIPKDYLTQNLIGHFHYMLGITAVESDWEKAERRFILARQAAPHNDVLFYNLGLVYRREGMLEKARAAFVRSDSINPRTIASKSAVHASDRIREIDEELARLSSQ